ncbi:DNA-binding response regulator [Hahella sp. CCB-MM4]|uniref:response regulator transcription factor n=1 Tax=Hahella sp. (strain CCB-MM4) TaxID=1926491 RepID=UPI000B9B55BC|nr:response regulator transcription factor [Hahella sp. CCB-MM4]OZG71010.1 DNA-binding response regulator [Hahella sp. CCB-MM4]
MNVLFVEDDERIAEFVGAGLRQQGFKVERVANGDEGFELALSRPFDVILLDIMVPGRDGLSVLKGLRKKDVETPIILLTARNELDDRIEGLNLGADDYLAKPFFVEELVARIHALLRRVSGERQNLLTWGDLNLDRLTREVKVKGETVELTRKEFKLLEFLMRSPQQVFTRVQILEYVWGYNFNPNTNVVDVCVQRIRRKLESVGVYPIEAVRGVGYRLQDPEDLH